MSTVLRRLLLLLALMFWQGGFMFYGGIVVPVGAEVLGSHREQGFVTQAVTNYLNAGGAVALIAWGWDLAVGHRAGEHRRRHWMGWALLVTLLSLLVWLHLRLDDLLVVSELRIIERQDYAPLHQAYLTISSLQWIVSASLLTLTIRAWRAEDAARVTL